MTQTHLKYAAAVVAWTVLNLQGFAPCSAVRAQGPAANPIMEFNRPAASDYPITPVYPEGQYAAQVERSAVVSSSAGGTASAAEYPIQTRAAGPEPVPAPVGTPAQAAAPTVGARPQDATLTAPTEADREFAGWFQTALRRWFSQPELPRADLDIRFGYWARLSEGNPILVGAYQGLDPSPFFNADGLFSDRLQTIDFSATEMDNDTDAARLNYYSPNVIASTRFDRYIHRQENDPLTNFNNSKSLFRGINFNAGEDFATMVEQTTTEFRGKLTENVNWRMNVLAIHRHGERQVRGLHRHVTCTKCHVNGGRQEIDWTTLQVEPIVEGRFGPVNVELSHQGQFLAQSDQLITDLGGGTPMFSKPLPYGYVPENNTQLSRLRFDVDVMEDTRFHANLFLGNTLNEDRDVHRRFDGLDLSLTNRALDGRLSLTAFGKRLNENSVNTPFFVVPEEIGRIPPLIDYGRTSTGLLGRWRLLRRSESFMGLSLNGGYEYREIDRENAVYVAYTPGNPVFDQRKTTSHLFHLGTVMDWSDSLDSYVRYKMDSTQGPIYGVTSSNATVNTSLPEHIDFVEVGGDWTPTENLCLNLSIDIEPRRNKSDVADFNEMNLPMALDVSYTPVPRWSLSGGYMYDPSWVRQQITLGDDAPPETTAWDYSGVSQRVHFATRYALTESISLSYRLQYIRGQDTLSPPPPWQGLPIYSNVAIDNVQVSAGTDWWIREHVLLYLRYDFSDYSVGPTHAYDGTAHMALLGFNAFY